jgi:hypothetical protein
VKCTATVATPAGTGGPLTVNAHQDVQLLRPNAPIPHIVPYIVEVNDNDPFQTGNPWMLYVGPQGNNGIFGITWDESVSNPAPFTTATGGHWNFTQLTSFVEYDSKTSTGTTHYGGNYGKSGLDGNWPYNNLQYPLDGQDKQSGDDPGVGLLDTYSHYDIDQDFSTYVMYQPPGTDVQWVPLWLFTWEWTANPDIPGTSWSAWSPDTQAGVVTSMQPAISTAQPTWASLVTNIGF